MGCGALAALGVGCLLFAGEMGAGVRSGKERRSGILFGGHFRERRGKRE